jgi:ATP-binding cassette subfamily B multidrug efflux pump
MLRWFESRLDPYPKDDPVEPPKGLLAFCLHYSHGAKRWLALMAASAAAVAIGEIIIFGFIGDVVNWLAGANPDTFLQTDGWKLALMGAMLAAGPAGAAAGLDTLIMHQTLLGNFPQRIRWMSASLSASASR